MLGRQNAERVPENPDDAPAIASDFILSRQGVWLKKNWFDATFNFCYRGSYSSLLADYLARQTRQFAFIDIGANQGLYTLIAVRSELCTCAHAFEPVLKTFTLLEENIQANPNSGKITAHRLAISDHSGHSALSIMPGHSGAATFRATPLRIFCASEKVHTVGSAWLKEIKPADPVIIKVDVEGHEEVVLRSLGEAGYLDTAIAVYYEVDTRWSIPGTLRHILEERDFSVFTQTGHGRHHDVLATRK